MNSRTRNIPATRMQRRAVRRAPAEEGIHLSTRDAETFARAIMTPPEPGPALKRAVSPGTGSW